MERQIRKNLLAALGVSGALIAIGAAAALLRDKGDRNVERRDEAPPAGEDILTEKRAGDTVPRSEIAATA